MTTQAEIRQASMARQGDFETLFNNILAAADSGDYHKTTRGIILLADQLTEHESIGTWLDIGEFGEFTLADLVVGGYWFYACLLYTSPSPRDVEESRMPSSA